MKAQQQSQTKLKIQEKNNRSKPKIEEQPSKSKPIQKHSKKDSLTHLPSIQDMMNLSPENREDGVAKHFQAIRPFLHQYMLKKIGSRVLQLIFKWGNQDIRKTIHQCLMQNWKELIRAPETLRLILTISKSFKITSIEQDALHLQSSFKGAKILQQYVEADYTSLDRIKNKFYTLRDSALGGDVRSQQLLHNLGVKSIEKNYYNLPLAKLLLRLGLSTMFEEEKSKVLQQLAGKVQQWTNDEEGVRLFIEVTNQCDSKLKKNILKAFKGHVAGIAQMNTPIYVALIKIITEIDDTVFVNKTLLAQIEGLLPLMSQHKHAFAVVFSLMSPRNNNMNVLGKYEHTPSGTTCKKAQNVRKTQIRKELYPALLTFLQGQNLYHLLCNHFNSKLVLAVYKALQEDDESQFQSFVKRIAEFYLKDATDALKGNTFSNCLITHPDANKILKNILLSGSEGIQYYCDKFAQLATHNVKDFLKSKASYILLALIQKGGREYLTDEVKRSKLRFEEMVAGEHYAKLVRK